MTNLVLHGEREEEKTKTKLYNNYNIQRESIFTTKEGQYPVNHDGYTWAIFHDDDDYEDDDADQQQRDDDGCFY